VNGGGGGGGVESTMRIIKGGRRGEDNEEDEEDEEEGPVERQRRVASDKSRSPTSPNGAGGGGGGMTNGPSRPYRSRKEIQEANAGLLQQFEANVYNIFITVRDLFLGTSDGTMTLQELVECFQSSSSSSSTRRSALLMQIPPHYNVELFFLLAMRFMASSERIHSFLSIALPSEPILRLDDSAQPHRWVWNLAQSSRISNEQLYSLEQLFFFAITRAPPNSDDFIAVIKHTLNLRAQLTIPTSSHQSVADFRKQESERYKNPEKSWIYVFNGLTTIVAPMKRISVGPSNRAREHFLLKSDRPPFINLIDLVRDAAARLPGGIGTRLDVTSLLRDSQYVVEDADEKHLNSVVGGALDRLHSDDDPCVKYLSDLKLWIYLHRLRKPEEFFGSGLSTSRKRTSALMNTLKKLRREEDLKRLTNREQLPPEEEDDVFETRENSNNSVGSNGSQMKDSNWFRVPSNLQTIDPSFAEQSSPPPSSTTAISSPFQTSSSSSILMAAN